MLYGEKISDPDEVMIEFTAEGTFAPALILRSGAYKYIYCETDPGMMFDLENDPDEFRDLGQSKEYLKKREELKELLLQRLISRKNRVAATDEFVLKERDYSKEDGIMIGIW